jgi:hypothetical protein
VINRLENELRPARGEKKSDKGKRGKGENVKI